MSDLVSWEDAHTVAVEDVPKSDEAIVGSSGYVVRVGMKLDTLKTKTLM